MSSEKLRIALIGCGRAAQLHLPARRRIEDVEVAAVADIDGQAAERVAACFGISDRYTTAEPILNDPKIDAVAAVCLLAFMSRRAVRCSRPESICWSRSLWRSISPPATG